MMLIVSPLVHLPHLLEKRKPSHVLTLISPDAPDVVCEGIAAACHQVLRFNDIVEAREGLVAPDRQAVQAILDFAAQWDRAAPLLIHCLAGISRSTAAAYAISCRYGYAGQEDALAVRLRAASPYATPNPLVTQLADDILGRGGAMTRAVAAIGRGEEAVVGLPFDYPL